MTLNHYQKVREALIRASDSMAVFEPILPSRKLVDHAKWSRGDIKTALKELDAAEAAQKMRVQHLLEINNAYLERARRAEEAHLIDPDALYNNIEIVQYISRWGGGCRDCADANGICDGTGLPCGKERHKAIEHVLKAFVYGMRHGFIATIGKLS